jgi:hypothetical protein
VILPALDGGGKQSETNKARSRVSARNLASHSGCGRRIGYWRGLAL